MVVNPFEILFSSPWFWLVLILLILIVAFRAQLARLIDRTQKAKVEAGKDGAKLELDASTSPATEKTPVAPPPATAQPTQNVQVAQGATLTNTTFGDIGNVIVKPASSPAPAPPKTASDATIRPAGGRRTAVIRELLTAALNDDELTALCFDYFPAVHHEFASGMTTGQKIQRLIEYCQRHDLYDRLLAVVRERNPSQYQYFEPRLKS